MCLMPSPRLPRGMRLSIPASRTYTPPEGEPYLYGRGLKKRDSVNPGLKNSETLNHMVFFLCECNGIPKLLEFNGVKGLCLIKLTARLRDLREDLADEQPLKRLLQTSPLEEHTAALHEYPGQKVIELAPTISHHRIGVCQHQKRMTVEGLLLRL